MKPLKDCLSIFNGGHLAIVILTAIGIAGTGVGVYTSLRSDITENRKAINDLRVELDKFMIRTDRWQSEQKLYDSEVRTRVLDADKDIRVGLRMLAEKLIDLKGK